MVATNNDSEADETVAELKARIAELGEALAARDAFLATAAHELRNPMTPVIGYVQRLRRMLQDGTRSLVDMEQTAARIEWLINLYIKRATTLLDVSRIATGRFRMEATLVDIDELAQATVAALEPACQHAGSTLTFSVDPQLTVVSDRLALEQILDNLLLNAVKYGAGKPIHLAVRQQGETFTIEVVDQGIGMKPEDQARIFLPFERAIAYASQAGFGIGLWVVRQLVNEMGGTIRVESAPGAGTTFTVSLPRSAALG